MAPERDPEYAVVWPSAPTRRTTFEAPPRRTNLAGARIGLLSDGVFQSDLVCALVEKALRRRIGDVEFVEPAAFGEWHAADEDRRMALIPGLLRKHQCDVAIVGVGA